jgi:cobalt-precorrin-5B (C1)-methyltransferase
MSNFVGFALECIERNLSENGRCLSRLWVVGHPGKLGKILDGAWDTHSQQSENAVKAICRIAREFGLPDATVECLAQSNTVEGVIERLAAEPAAPNFWSVVERQIGVLISTRLQRVGQVSVRLFQMNGKALGGME